MRSPRDQCRRRDRGRIAVYYDELGQQAFFGLLGVIALVAALVVLAMAKPLTRLVPD